MFSPYYAWSGWGDPTNHCAMNVALYAAGRNRWAMTERGSASLARDADSISIGPSSMHWEGEALRISIDERTAPLPFRVRGTVILRPDAVAAKTYALDARARHNWRPIAPRARIEATFDSGGTSWRGDAYFDSNWGDEPLERAFTAWDWSRAHAGDATVVYYDVLPREGERRSLALKFDRSGEAVVIDSPPTCDLPDTFWRLRPAARGAANEQPRLVRMLEDAPFYARSLLAGEIDGVAADIMHESLSLDRFRNPVVRAMLPFRMPRIARRC